MMPDEFSRFSRADIQRAIKHQACPACGAGPFRNLGIHIAKTHGLSAARLKERFGLNRSTSLASTEYAAKQSRSQLAAMARDPVLAALRKNAGAGALLLNGGVVRRDEMREHASEVGRRVPMAAWAAIAARREAGERRTDIARDYGVCRSTITNVVKRVREQVAHA